MGDAPETELANLRWEWAEKPTRCCLRRSFSTVGESVMGDMVKSEERSGYLESSMARTPSSVSTVKL